MLRLIGLASAIVLSFAAAGMTPSYGQEVDPDDYPVKPHHQRLHFECKHCHGGGPAGQYAPLDTADCLGCHGSHEVIADRTAELGYYDNIHAAPHYPEMECGLCHQEHDLKERNYCLMYERDCESENYCVMCHSQDVMLELRVP